MTKLQQVEQNIASKEVIINQNFNCVSPAGLFSRKNPLATGITFSYYGGLYPDSTGATKTINDGSITLTDSATNYIEFSQSTSTVVSNTSAFTAGNIPIAICTCSGGIITSYTDSRIAGFIPSGSTGSGGGGGGGSSATQVYTEMFELTAKNPTSSQSIQVTIAGGKYPKPGLSVSGSNYYTVADFTTTGLFSGEDTYYMLEITASGGAKIIESQASTAFSRTAIRKLLYVARPDSSDATKVGAIIDLRSYNIYILNKTVFKSANYTAGAKSTTLDFSWIKGLQDSDYNYFGASMTNYPPLFAVHVSLRCKTAEKGYAAGDETEYKTGNMLASGLGNAYQYVASTGNVIVSQGSMVYVWNKTNQAYEVPTDSYWDILVRIRLDI